MSKYKVTLTVQDEYGMTKDLDVGTIEGADWTLTEADAEKLDTEFEMATDEDIENLQSRVATLKTQIEDELPALINNMIIEAKQNINTIKYRGFKD